MIATKPPTAEELMAKYVRGRRRSKRLVNEIAEMHLPKVRKLAQKIAAQNPVKDLADDFTQVGMMGVLDTMRTFDPDRGTNFWTLASIRVRGEILDYLREIDPMSRMTRKAIKAIKDMPPDDVSIDSVMSATGVSRQIVVDAIRLATMDTVSANERYKKGREGHRWILHDYRHEDRQSNIDLRADLIGMMHQCLSDQERSIMVLYHLNGLTMKEVGVIHGLSESRISQVLSAALKTVKAAFPEFPS